MNLAVSDFYLANNVADIFPKVSFKQCAIDKTVLVLFIYVFAIMDF
jgi:hypothetical protein